MAATFTPTANHGLSETAQGLNSDRLENEVLVAEEVLKLSGISLTGDRAEKAKKAVALQVNLQVRMGDRGDVVAESKGAQSFSYANVGGKRVAVDPLAWKLAESLRGPGVRSSSTRHVVSW